MFFWKILYNLIILPSLTLFAFLGSLFSKKLRLGTRGRFKTYTTLKNFKKSLPPDTTIYWFHAASHGEFEQVRPVLEGMKEVEPNCQAVVSFFSPSGFNYVNDEIIDCKVYLPIDYPWVIKKVLTLVRPRKIILAAYDIWPNLIWGSKRMGIPSTLFAARFSEGTSKLLPVIRSFYRNVYSCLSAIYTITEEDHQRLQQILYPAGQPIVRVLGNPRYDRVKSQADKFTKERTESVLLREKRLILGSLHPEDEQVILEPTLSLLNDVPDLNLLWVPHEPNERTVGQAEKLFQERGFSVERLGDWDIAELSQYRVVIVDTVGKLSKLYWSGQLAYIGGGFSTGVHKVMEPAIARLPVFFGPRYKNSHEAEELLATGGGFSIKTGTDYFIAIKELLQDRKAFLDASFAATDLIHRNLGSATRVVRNLIHD